MAKRMQPASGPQSSEPPRLGAVVRFTSKAGGVGIKRLEEGGYRVASSRDFKGASSVPNDFDGADVQYFERFGIAIVRNDEDRLAPMLEKAAQNREVSGVRPERSYRALGLPMQRTITSPQPVVPPPLPIDADYVRGYRDGINELADRLLGANGTVLRAPSTQSDEMTGAWGLQATRVLESSLTGSGIKVAVLDTGFDARHPDFVGRTVTRKLFASKSSDDDLVGHGTHCIGTACGPLRPVTGPRYGVAYEAEIYAGKVLGDDGFGTDRSIIAGMDWALEQGCHVISMSLGATTDLGDQPSDDYEQIGQVCLDAGALVVAAAGNGSRRPNRVAPVNSPANASTILAVAAIDVALAVAEFSCGGMNTGQEVDIAAPGVDVLSSLPGESYGRWNGTSMATPHVAGIAALIAQSDSKFRGWALWARLLQLVRPLALPARDVGKGLVQAPPT